MKKQVAKYVTYAGALAIAVAKSNVFGHDVSNAIMGAVPIAAMLSHWFHLD